MVESMAQSETANGVWWDVRLTDGRFARVFLPSSPAVVFSRDFERSTGPAEGSVRITTSPPVSLVSKEAP